MSDNESVPVYDLEIFQGETWWIKLTLTDDNGAPIPLTSYTAKMQIRPYIGGPVLLTLTQADALTITPAAGEIEIDLTATQTEALQFITAVYDLFVTLSAARTPLLRGKVLVTPSVTKVA
jgi:hypothetical protein